MFFFYVLIVKKNISINDKLCRRASERKLRVTSSPQAQGTSVLERANQTNLWLVKHLKTPLKGSITIAYVFACLYSVFSLTCLHAINLVI